MTRDTRNFWLAVVALFTVLAFWMHVYGYVKHTDQWARETRMEIVE